MPGRQNSSRITLFYPCQKLTGRIPPTTKQFCSGEDYGAYPLRDPDSAEPVFPFQQKGLLPVQIPRKGPQPAGSGLPTQTPGATPHKAYRIREPGSGVNESYDTRANQSHHRDSSAIPLILQDIPRPDWSRCTHVDSKAESVVRKPLVTSGNCPSFALALPRICFASATQPANGEARTRIRPVAHECDTSSYSACLTRCGLPFAIRHPRIIACARQ